MRKGRRRRRRKRKRRNDYEKLHKRIEEENEIQHLQGV
jgi:hypothetical protein